MKTIQLENDTVTIPVEMSVDELHTIKYAIDLQIRVLTKPLLTSKKGFVNKFKHSILGYPLLQKVEKK